MISYLVIEPLPPVYTGRSPRVPAAILGETGGTDHCFLWSVGMGLRPAKLHEKLSGHADWQMWRTHSCVPRRHSCRRPLPRGESVEGESTPAARGRAPRG